MKQLYYRYLAFVYAFTYRSTHRRFMGFAISSWIKLFAWAFLLVGWIRGWDQPMVLGTLLLVGWIYFSYWGARRAGYIKFVADPTATPSPTNPVPLPTNQRVQMWATGIFIVRDEGDYALLRPAEYWQVPLGEHIVMVRVGPERFAYQFFDATGLLEVKPGCLLFGSMLRHTLAVTVLEIHNALEPSQYNFARPDKLDEVSGKKRILYFTFNDDPTLLAVWHNLVYDARRARA